MGGISNEKAQSTSKTWTWVATCHTRDRSPQQTVLKELNATFSSRTNRKQDLFSFSHVFPQHIPDMIQRICMIFMTKERLSDWSVAWRTEDLRKWDKLPSCRHNPDILFCLTRYFFLLFLPCSCSSSFASWLFQCSSDDISTLFVLLFFLRP